MFSFPAIRIAGFRSSTLAKISSNQRLLETESLSFKLSLQQNDLSNHREMSSVHGGNADFRKDFLIRKEYPVGPHKKLPPFVKHKDKRTGEVRQGKWENYKYKVHYPEDGKYTIKKLELTKLGGRDQVTGRKIIGMWGGGNKQKARWVDWRRLPADWDLQGPDLVERIVNICYDPMRKSKLALTGYGEKMRWQIATSSMEIGDLIRTSGKIPPNPIRPKEGDSHPLGALPPGTDICLVQWPSPDSDEVKIADEKDFAKILRKIGDRVIIQREATKYQYSLDERCQCVVGKVSIHPLKDGVVGSPNRNRWWGIQPRSGLWHRKTGIHGRKIRALPPVDEVNKPLPEKNEQLMLNIDSEGIMGKPVGRKRYFDIDKW